MASFAPCSMEAVRSLVAPPLRATTLQCDAVRHAHQINSRKLTLHVLVLSRDDAQASVTRLARW